MEGSPVETEARRNEQEENDDLQREMVYPKPNITRKSNGRLAYQCESCGLLLYSEKILNRHMAKHNEEETNGDDTQNVNVEDQEVVVPPARKKRPSSHSCTFCSKVFYKKSHLRDHIRSHASERQFWCTHPYCEQNFTDKNILQNHLLSHSNEKPHKCCTCQKSFKTVKTLNQPVKQIHLNSSLKQVCESCFATFDRGHDLKRHLETHLDPLSRPSFQCSACKWNYTRKSSLCRHIKSYHSKDKPVYKCSFCGHTFFSEDDLHQHEMGHNKKKNFSCDICNIKFTSLVALKKHWKDHKRAEKLVQQCAKVQQVFAKDNFVLVPNIRCNSFESTFPSEQELAQHFHSIHNLPERPFCCEVQGCDKASKRKDHLNFENLRKYPCSRCGKTFKRRGHLKKHNVRVPDCDVVIRDKEPKHPERRGKT